MKNYGKEVILDLHECEAKFTRKSIQKYFDDLCKLIDMEQCKVTWWDDLYTPKAEKQTEPHLVGTSAVQFIKTSNITIHTLDIMKRVYLNVFSCKNFKSSVVKKFSKDYFQGKIIQCKVIDRI